MTVSSRVVVLSPDELRVVLSECLTELLEGVGYAAAPAALLDRAGLARALGVAVPTVDRMRQLPDFPELRVGDAPRFELPAVLEWLRGRKPAGQAGGPASKPAGNPEAIAHAAGGSVREVLSATRKRAKSHGRESGATGALAVNGHGWRAGEQEGKRQ